jgi:hypothetical protein
MSNELMRPIDADTAHAIEETAKFGTKLLDSGDKAAGYATGVFERLPHNLVGLVGDWVCHQRIRQWAKLQVRTKQILNERGIKEPYEEVSPSIALPLLEAAVDETREELSELWAKLLAAAMDPKRRDLIRQSFVQIVKQMEAFDVLVLKVIANNQTHGQGSTSFDVVVESLGQGTDVRNDVLESFEALAKLRCISFRDATVPGQGQGGPMNNPYLTPFGMLLMRAVSG